MASPQTRRTLAVVATLALVASLGVAAAPGAAGALPDDNGRIAFLREGDIWTMNADGTDQRVVVDAAPEGTLRLMSGPAWSPDGKKLAFSAYVAADVDARADVWVIGGDGTGLVNLTKDSSVSDWSPSWSPDGAQIGWVSGRTSFARGDIWVMDADGANRRNVTRDDALQETPTWSPDGTRIAYTASQVVGNTIQPNSEIWAVDVDGSNKVNLTNSPQDDSGPAWSPDGAAIAFTRWFPSGNYSDVWVMGADGNNQRSVTDDPTMFDNEPSWSPDGSLIAFTSFGPFVPPPDPAGEAPVNDPPADIYVMGNDGSGKTRLTTGDEWDYAPAWQPLPGVHHVGLVDPDQGRWHLRDQGTVRSFFYGNPGDTPFLGDWDCDGEDTPGLYRRADGFVYLRNSNTQGIADVRFFFGNPGDLPLAGDFDGDGCDTLSLYRPSEGRVFVINELGSEDEGLGAADFDYLFGNPGDQPFTGDFDGDGVDTVGLHRESTGLVYFRNSNTQGIADVSFVFGDPGDRFVAGDWTDDGTDTAGLFRPTGATFFFRNSNTQGIADAALPWGEADWLPVAGDFSLTGLSPAAVDVGVFFGVPGSVECDDVAAVTRKIEPPAVLAGAMKQLLEGPTAAETAAGYTSWYSPATAGMLSWVTLDAGTARVDFQDFSGIIPNASTSCGSAALLAALNATATQFPTVDEAVYSFDGDVAAFYTWLQRDAPPGF